MIPGRLRGIRGSIGKGGRARDSGGLHQPVRGHRTGKVRGEWDKPDVAGPVELPGQPFSMNSGHFRPSPVKTIYIRQNDD